MAFVVARDWRSKAGSVSFTTVSVACEGPGSLRPDSTKTLSGKSEGFTLFVCDFSFGFLGVSEWPQ